MLAQLADLLVEIRNLGVLIYLKTTQGGDSEAANDRGSVVRQRHRAACEAAGESARLWQRAKRYGEGQRPCGFATTRRSGAAAEKGHTVLSGTGASRSVMLSASAIEHGGGGEPSGATSLRASTGPLEERKGGAHGVEGKQILEKRSILRVDGRDHIQIYGGGTEIQTNGREPPVSGVRQSNRWMARL